MYGFHPEDFKNLCLFPPMELPKASYEKVKKITVITAGLASGVALLAGSISASVLTNNYFSNLSAGPGTCLLTTEVFIVTYATRTGIFIGSKIGMHLANRFLRPIE